MIQTRYAKSDGVSLAYQTTGESSLDLIYVPGAAAGLTGAMDFAPTARYIEGLSRFCRLTRFDKRATGMSEHGEIPPTIEAQVPDVDTIRQAGHAGEVYEVDGRLIGLCVNHAARVVDQAAPDEILTTTTVQGLVEGSGFEFADRGVFDLKGIGARRLLRLR